MTATSQLRVPVQVPVENGSRQQKHLGFCANLGFHAVRVVTSQRFVHMRVSRVWRAILAYFLLKYHEKKCRFAVHKLNKECQAKGAFYILIPSLLEDREKFFNYFRMYPEQYQGLLRRVRGRIHRSGCNWNPAICADQQLAVTLR